ncbi:MAG TPA: type II secretion system F family protein [Blastocatellia bacterium]|nr:type II secretion system F family protein [Blastocatellia bacterium]
MDLVPLSALIGAVVFFLLFGTVYLIMTRAETFQQRVAKFDTAEEKMKVSWRDYLKRTERVFKPLGEMIPRSPQELSRQGKRLMAAGIRHREGPRLFYGVKLCLAVAFICFFAANGFLTKNPLGSICMSVLFGAAVPDIWLNRKMRARKERIQLAIPDVLDLTVVCVEAGLGLDQSLMRIGQEIRRIHPDLSEELHLYNLEVNAGRSRAEALRNLAGRTEVDDLKSLTAVLIQTDRFGTSIAQSLRVFSDSLRTKRRQRAEERAAKTSIKMIPVLVFFIFPAIFIIVVFPAFIAVVRELLPKIGGQ